MLLFNFPVFAENLKVFELWLELKSSKVIEDIMKHVKI